MGLFHILLSRFYLSLSLYLLWLDSWKEGQAYTFRHVQSKFCAHPTSYPMSIEGTFPLGNVAGEWNSVVHIVRGTYPDYHGRNIGR